MVFTSLFHFSDVNEIVKALYGECPPPIVLIGHSMGGAVAVEAAALISSTIALCVLDVVEGSALESLSAMQSVLRGRPKSFKSIEYAIQWRCVFFNYKQYKINHMGTSTVIYSWEYCVFIS